MAVLCGQMGRQLVESLEADCHWWLLAAGRRMAEDSEWACFNFKRIFPSKPLLHPHPISFEDLAVAREGPIVDTLGAAPVTSHSMVQDDVELLVEGPLVLVCGRLLTEDLVDLVVHAEENDVGTPLHGPGVPDPCIHCRGPTDLRADGMVVCLGVHGTVELPRVVANVLHDVNLTAARPVTIGALCGHHPMRRPGSPRSANLAGADMELAVEPILARLQLGRGEPVPSIILEAGADL